VGFFVELESLVLEKEEETTVPLSVQGNAAMICAFCEEIHQ